MHPIPIASVLMPAFAVVSATHLLCRFLRGA
jgi:hypothetical protein